jgi:hypothetical protein
VAGELVWNGDIQFSGKGYFAFEALHQLTFGPNATRFYLRGTFDNRYIQLRGTTLSIPSGVDLELENGAVQYNDYASIEVGQGCKVTGKSLRLYGVGRRGFSGDLAGNVDLFYCRFDGIAEPLYFTGGTGSPFGSNPNKIKVNSGDFRNFTNGTYIRNRNSVLFENSTFNGSGLFDGYYGLYSDNNFDLVLRNCTLHSFGSTTSSNLTASQILGDATMKEALRVQGGFLAWVDACQIRNGDIGIGNRSVTLDLAQSHLAANLLITNSTLEYCAAGVSMQGNATTGLVVSSCSRYIGNNFGISGTDVRLLIDPLLFNPNPLFVPAANVFVRDVVGAGSSQNKYIDVCYTLSTPGGISLANNYWAVPDYAAGTGWLPVTNPLPGINLVNGALCAGTQAFTVLPTVGAAPVRCGNQEPCTNCLSDCPVDVPTLIGAETVRERFMQGYAKVLADDFAGSVDDFQPVSDMFDPEQPTTQSNNCRAFVVAARSLVAGGEQSDQDFGRPGAERGVASDGSVLLVMPNPATSEVLISLPEAGYHVRIWDAYGRLVSESVSSFANQAHSVATWPAGLYTIEATEPLTAQRHTVRLLVAH